MSESRAQELRNLLADFQREMSRAAELFIRCGSLHARWRVCAVRDALTVKTDRLFNAIALDRTLDELEEWLTKNEDDVPEWGVKAREAAERGENGPVIWAHGAFDANLTPLSFAVRQANTVPTHPRRDRPGIKLPAGEESPT
jgi:hypothetical protein